MRQTSVETSLFGSDFISMKQCCEWVWGLCYKLRMMGILVDFPTYILGDNQSVLCNTSNPPLSLKNKSSSIAFNFVREETDKNECRTACINTHLNPAVMLTNSLAGGKKRSRYIGCILYYIYWYTWWQWIMFNYQTTLTSQWLDYWNFVWWYYFIFWSKVWWLLDRRKWFNLL